MGNTQSTRRHRDSAEHREHGIHGNLGPHTADNAVSPPIHTSSGIESGTRRSQSRYSGFYETFRRFGGREHQDVSITLPEDHAEGDERGALMTETDNGMLQTLETNRQQSATDVLEAEPTALPGTGADESLDVQSGNVAGSQTHEPEVRLSRRLSLLSRSVALVNNGRLSLRAALRRRTDTASVANREIRGPFPIVPSDSHLPQHVDQLERRNSGISALTTDNHEHLSDESRPARWNRLSRARHSIHIPLTSFFGGSRNRGSMYVPRSPTPHPGHTSERSDAVSLSDSQHSIRHERERTAHELDAVEPETRHLLSASRIASGMTSIRRLPHGLRSRSTRLIRRGEHPPLSQVLQLAAAAIAAQLSGQASGSDGGRPIGGEAFDGSIQNFVQTLQEAASAQAGENIDLNATDGDLPPVNFMRVFQFPNDENGVPMGPPQNRSTTRTTNEGATDPDRSVTLVLVGVRSMPNLQDGSGHSGGAPGPGLDALLSLPFMPPANILRNGSSGALFRRSDTRTRGHRRHSLTNFNFPAQYESRRRSASRTGSREAAADQAISTTSNVMSMPLSESPPGPHPPPSTPADLRSGHATPVQRPSSASAAQTSLLPHLEEDSAQLDIPSPSLEPPATATTTSSHQRRRSDSDFARRPELGSGAARRNGVVEPDRTAAGAGRSWLIYVVGTNVSPDHPAFTMPSLFTDNPSYEDMQMLSTLLGPVKPPVATQDDVNSAGGTYRLIAQDRLLIAVPFESEALDSIAMVLGDRCLICLCDYEAEEQVRQLNSCNHIFHRDCIDEWLTTGRNSCPMCRGQGVKEQSPASNTASPPEQSI